MDWAEEVFNQYTDTAGNYHWWGTKTGDHIERVTIVQETDLNGGQR